MPATPAARPPFDLKSTAWTLMALRLHSADTAAVSAALDARFGETPDLFDDEALVLDLSPLAADEAACPDFAVLLAALRRHRLQPVAVQGGNAAQTAAARAAGLVEAMDPEPWSPTRPETAAAATEAAAGEAAAPSVEVPDEPAEAAAEGPAAEAAEAAATAPAGPAAAPRSTLVVDKPLRSGQRVYARGSDLVVLSVVSFGAEVIADGHIHVYAPLRGRAIAGARGDTSARIFSTCMEPQLVSIAGIYRTTENPLPAGLTGRPAQVRLDGESLIVEPLGT